MGDYKVVVVGTGGSDSSMPAVDLLVVGNVGAESIAGRLLGSVPTAVRRRANTEVLVVDATS